MGRKKAYVQNDAIKHIHVPQYKNLTVERVMEFVAGQPDIEHYLPDEPDLAKVPK